MSESAEITFSYMWDYPGLPYFGAGWGWGQVSPFDETMEILIGYAVLQIGSIVTNLNACSSIEKFVPPCRGSMETRRRLFASLESKQEKLWEEI